MHEMSIAIDIIDMVVETARRENAAQVERIEIEIGQLSGLLPDFIRVCLEAASQNTLAEEASFRIKTIPGRAECKHCHTCFDFPAYMTPCPKCGEYGASPLQGTEIKLVSITFDSDYLQ